MPSPGHDPSSTLLPGIPASRRTDLPLALCIKRLEGVFGYSRSTLQKMQWGMVTANPLPQNEHALRVDLGQLTANRNYGSRFLASEPEHSSAIWSILAWATDDGRVTATAATPFVTIAPGIHDWAPTPWVSALALLPIANVMSPSAATAPTRETVISAGHFLYWLLRDARLGTRRSVDLAREVIMAELGVPLSETARRHYAHFQTGGSEATGPLPKRAPGPKVRDEEDGLPLLHLIPGFREHLAMGGELAPGSVNAYVYALRNMIRVMPPDPSGLLDEDVRNAMVTSKRGTTATAAVWKRFRAYAADQGVRLPAGGRAVPSSRLHASAPSQGPHHASDPRAPSKYIPPDWDPKPLVATFLAARAGAWSESTATLAGNYITRALMLLHEPGDAETLRLYHLSLGRKHRSTFRFAWRAFRSWAITRGVSPIPAEVPEVASGRSRAEFPVPRDVVKAIRALGIDHGISGRTLAEVTWHNVAANSVPGLAHLEGAHIIRPRTGKGKARGSGVIAATLNEAGMRAVEVLLRWAFGPDEPFDLRAPLIPVVTGSYIPLAPSMVEDILKSG